MQELIEKYGLSYVYIGNFENWNMLRPKYHINIFDKKFEYWGSNQDYKNKVKDLTTEDLLFAFRCIISDALSYKEVEHFDDEAIIKFGQEFGYINSSDIWQIYTNTRNPEEYLSDEEIENCKNLHQAFEGCDMSWWRLDGCRKFPISGDWKLQDELYKILETLSDLGIE